MAFDPIIACSTGLATGSAIALIRISGFEKLENFQSCLTINLTTVEPRKVYLCHLKNIENGSKIDQITLTFFESPKSYTGENCLEFNVHGNPLNVEKIIKYLTQNFGLRQAKPGEFTLRAIQNGKMTFAQAEGLQALLNANSEFAMTQGLDLLSGQLNADYQALFQHYMILKSSVDLLIDFAEDIGQEQCLALFQKSLHSINSIVGPLVQRAKHSGSNLLECRVVLIGLPNSGKSTLFNSLLKKNRSIISPVAGTTRDYIENQLWINGSQFVLVDTAGIRETPDFIEKEGVLRSFDQQKNAFFTIYVHSALAPFLNINATVDLLVITHTDRVQQFDINRLSVPFQYKKLLILAGPIGPIQGAGPIEPHVSKTGPIEPPVYQERDMDRVKSIITDRYIEVVADNPILIERHASAIIEINQALKELQVEFDNYNKNNDIALLSHCVDRFGRSTSQLLGIVDSEHILNYIFSNFCIGK